MTQLHRYHFFRVLIFAEKKADVDTIYEYLLLKGVDVASIHGGKDQKDRHTGVDAFRRGEKDVLVATDVASKGLDFENIQHVINYDMPEDIENYGITNIASCISFVSYNVIPFQCIVSVVQDARGSEASLPHSSIGSRISLFSWT